MRHYIFYSATMPYGSFDRPIDEAKQQAKRDHAAMLRDVSLQELAATFAIEDVRELDNYQRELVDTSGKPNEVEKPDQARKFIRVIDDNLLEAPFTPKFRETYTTHQLGILACNTGLFDDEIEDELDNDPVIRQLNGAKERRPDLTDQYTPLVRIRRSIAALVLANVSNEPLRAFDSTPVA